MRSCDDGDVIVVDEEDEEVMMAARGGNDRILGEKAVAIEAIAKRMRKDRMVDGGYDNVVGGRMTIVELLITKKN